MVILALVMRNRLPPLSILNLFILRPALLMPYGSSVAAKLIFILSLKSTVPPLILNGDHASESAVISYDVWRFRLFSNMTFLGSTFVESRSVTFASKVLLREKLAIFENDFPGAPYMPSS